MSETPAVVVDEDFTELYSSIAIYNPVKKQAEKYSFLSLYLLCIDVTTRGFPFSRRHEAMNKANGCPLS